MIIDEVSALPLFPSAFYTFTEYADMKGDDDDDGLSPCPIFVCPLSSPFSCISNISAAGYRARFFRAALKK